MFPTSKLSDPHRNQALAQQIEGPLRNTHALIAGPQLAKDQIDRRPRCDARLRLGVTDRHAEALFKGHYHFNPVQPHKSRKSARSPGLPFQAAVPLVCCVSSLPSRLGSVERFGFGLP